MIVTFIVMLMAEYRGYGECMECVEVAVTY